MSRKKIILQKKNHVSKNIIVFLKNKINSI